MGLTVVPMALMIPDVIILALLLMALITSPAGMVMI